MPEQSVDGNYRRVNFGGLVIQLFTVWYRIVIIYSPDGSNISGSRGREYDG